MSVTVDIQEKQKCKDIEIIIQDIDPEDANEILRWCFENNINADLVRHAWAPYIGNITVWEIKDEKERLLFLLRWGK